MKNETIQNSGSILEWNMGNVLSTSVRFRHINSGKLLRIAMVNK